MCGNVPTPAKHRRLRFLASPWAAWPNQVGNHSLPCEGIQPRREQPVISPSSSQSQPERVDRRIRVLLYTVIPSNHEERPLRHTPFALLRNRLRRGLEMLRWRMSSAWKADFATFSDVESANRGDIAIRIGLRSALERAFEGRWKMPAAPSLPFRSASIACLFTQTTGLPCSTLKIAHLLRDSFVC